MTAVSGELDGPRRDVERARPVSAWACPARRGRWEVAPGAPIYHPPTWVFPLVPRVPESTSHFAWRTHCGECAGR